MFKYLFNIKNIVKTTYNKTSVNIENQVECPILSGFSKNLINYLFVNKY